MSINDLNKALKDTIKDEAMVSYFLSVWPVIESILQAFASATKLPIFVYLENINVFHSSIDTMPPFCTEMLGSEMAGLCIKDGAKRAKKIEQDISKGIQLCHAGMVNGRREIETGCVGRLSILFGARKSITSEAILRRDGVIQIAKNINAGLASTLQEADKRDNNSGAIESSDSILMDAIANIIQQFLNATVGFRSRTLNMAHELTLMMLGTGLHTKRLHRMVDNISNSNLGYSSKDMLSTSTNIISECRLGLYIVRNFLSQSSEKRYKEVVRPQFSLIDIGQILMEMVELHRAQAATKGIEFELSGIQELPVIYGSEMEICRIFYNILNNAIKYSYHSVAKAQRVIRIKTRVPYDPGFQERRFSISVENYGLGASKEEVKYIFAPGFRGQRAISEVPVGAGIGLSEAQKIIRTHGGKIKFKSEELHKDDSDIFTYLTTVELIFPYKGESRFSNRRSTN
jgi:signal transduction histidine kinase